MLTIHCPNCGPRGHHEFTYGGDATVRRPPPEAPLEQMVDYVYLRDNPCGPHLEYWHHVVGCRRWIRVQRNTRTHDMLGVEAGTEASR
jgi:methylglutamate dehydrogenase subunit B